MMINLSFYCTYISTQGILHECSVEISFNSSKTHCQNILCYYQALMNGVPLPEKHLNADEFEEVVLMDVMRTTQTLQRAVYKGQLEDKHDVVDWLMSLPNIMPR